jgi:hypothetical protein
MLLCGGWLVAFATAPVQQDARDPRVAPDAPEAPETPQAQSAADSATAALPRIRERFAELGVELPAAVPVVAASAAEFAAAAAARSALETPADRREGLVAIHRSLGIVPADLDLAAIEAAARAASHEAIFDPATGAILLAPAPRDASWPLSLPPQLVRAMRHSASDLAAFLAASTSDDEALARTALVTGEAVVAANRYFARFDAAVATELLGADLLTRFDSDLDAALAREGAPAWLRARLDFVGRAGRDFVLAAHDSGDPARLAELFTDPPRSTEQLLHPEKWLRRDRADEPLAVAPPAIDAALLARFRRIHHDRLGEFGCELLLRHAGDPVRAVLAARGFGGDAIELWQRDDGARLLAWSLVLDSEQDGVEMLDGLRKLLERRFPLRDGEGAFTVETDDSRTLCEAREVALPQRLHGVAVRDGASVLFLLADRGDVELASMHPPPR